MKIQFCSDLHLEFPENLRWLSRNPLLPEGDILVLAGDVITLADIEKAADFIDRVGDQYAAVYWVPGNHVYYGYDISDKPDPLYEKIRSNVFLVNNQSVIYDGVRLIFSTLWSRIDASREWDMQRSLSDFSVIEYQGRTFRPKDFSQLHNASVDFLKTTSASKHAGPTVVVSHHVPTLVNYPPVYKNSTLTPAFATELSDLIVDSKPDYWIYGHHHINVPEFVVGKTKMLTNQLGYVRQYEHGSFQRGCWFTPLA